MDVKLIGNIIRALGIGLLFAAYMMDTTIDTGDGRVYNIGLLSQQNTLSLVGALFLIAGIFLYVLSKDSPKKGPTETELEADRQERTDRINNAVNWVVANVIRPIKTWIDKRNFYIRLMVSSFVGVTSLLFFDNLLNFYSILATIYILIITPSSKAVQHALIANAVVFIAMPILIISLAVFAKASGITINNADGVYELLVESAAIGLSGITGWIKFILFPIAISIVSLRLIPVIKSKLISASNDTSSEKSVL